MARRRRFLERSPFGPPLAPARDNYAQPMPGAFVPGNVVPLAGRDTEQNLIYPRLFDYRVIVAAPASGTTIFLIGDQNAASAPTPGGLNSQRVPQANYAVVHGIFPYLEGGAGPVSQARIPGAGVTITWRVLIDNAPDPAFGNLQHIIAPWNSQENRSLVYLRSGQQLTCSVTPIDPVGLYTYVGIRILGVTVPIDYEARA